MFINLNYSLSIILHLLVICCLIFIFKIEKQTNIYNDVININLKTLKTFKTEDISKKNNSIDIKKDKESKKEVNKNTETITEIKTPTKEIKKIDKNKNLFILRHNIAARELIKYANSEAFLERELPNLKEINNLLRRDITIISGDGGAFKKQPRFYCREFGNIKYIINGIGGLRGDTILVINKNKIFRFILN